jgi:hypothetical protein
MKSTVLVIQNGKSNSNKFTHNLLAIFLAAFLQYGRDIIV